MKIHWLSNSPTSPTGYGNQSKLFLPRLQEAGHEMSMTTFYGSDGAIINWHGIPIFPRGYHMYGQDIASANAHYCGADILIGLMDAWVCAPELLQQNNVRWVPWFPIDSEPLPGAVKQKVTQAYRRIVYSHFAEKMMEQAELDCYYVPHGVDAKAFTPQDKRESRARMKLPQDAYIIGMVAANKGFPSRKNFVEQIAAFRGFHSRHPDSVLYLHTQQANPEGMDIPEYIENIGLQIGKDVIFAHQHQLQVGGYGDADMAALYSSFDVLSSVSMGEGFGIPILEAQACGCPVIVGDWTSMGELCFSGRKVDRAQAVPYYTLLGAFMYIPFIGVIEQLYEEEFAHPSDRKRARNGALQYDADYITRQYWKPVLEKIERDIKETEGGISRPCTNQGEAEK